MVIVSRGGDSASQVSESGQRGYPALSGGHDHADYGLGGTKGVLGHLLDYKLCLSLVCDK
jgi:hypothetical protein